MFSGTIFGPHRDGGGDSHQRQSQMRGNLEKLPAETNNAPLQEN